MKVSDEMVEIALERYKRPIHLESHTVAMKAALDAVFDHIAGVGKMVEPKEKPTKQKQTLLDVAIKNKDYHDISNDIKIFMRIYSEYLEQREI